ncbi:hypothetical protein [Longimicrobium sp.]|uniref:hypothetical protein n=1 Tax=Longimicrobium sp. TaxID=2029185 RepID=UPI002E3597CC|nr:hypothetical protein [Longimicrobium sp.]HEX6036814.1 hypothetical protein [Longimicrobium sp.]
MRVPAAGTPRWLLVVGAPPAGGFASRTLREALRAGVAARGTAPGAGPFETGNDGRGTALEEK